MKLAVTVNLGNYSNMRIESSEHDDFNDCKKEICLALDDFDVPQIEDFQAKIFRDVNRGALLF